MAKRPPARPKRAITLRPSSLSAAPVETACPDVSEVALAEVAVPEWPLAEPETTLVTVDLVRVGEMKVEFPPPYGAPVPTLGAGLVRTLVPLRLTTEAKEVAVAEEGKLVAE